GREPSGPARRRAAAPDGLRRSATMRFVPLLAAGRKPCDLLAPLCGGTGRLAPFRYHALC
ncbi:hypothetical protein, partial [Stieleria sp.]|uniref:hypothetical protein n=1 Tax=Stieleria sp. TaxID=2795976 RepID=UPI0035694BDB